MPLCRNCELVVVHRDEVYCCRECTLGGLCDARWQALPRTTHALQRGEEALLHFPGQNGGPNGNNYFRVVIRDFYLKHPLSDSLIRV